MALNEKLDYLSTTKNEIKQAINTATSNNMSKFK